MNKALTIFGALALALLEVHAQSEPVFSCHTDEAHLLEQLHDNDPVKLAEMQQAEQQLEQFTQQYVANQSEGGGGASFVIPIVFHIIHDNGPENISDAQIHDAVRILNRDMRKLNADTAFINPAFAGLATDALIEFRLAQLDPNGNCTKGINRIASQLTYDGTQTMKNLIQWPRDKYLNVWICAYADGAAGYTLTPGSVDSWWGRSADGIVQLHNYTGSIGTGSDSRSRTLTHEVGHWINLRHLWGPTNSPGDASNCSSDDNVSDTPNTIGWTACNINGQSCGSLDNVQNYMEYSYCSSMFTPGQRARMHAALNSNTAERNQLWQQSNLVATGTAGPDLLCEADFTADQLVICAGDSVRFNDLSYHGATQWSWTFQGGMADDHTIADPMVFYANPGEYDVTLVASNSSGSETTTRTAYIRVLPATGGQIPFAEGFENTTALPNNEWVLFNREQNAAFEVSTAASFTGSKSIFLNNYASNDGDLDELISNTYDLSQITDAEVSFRFAFARRTASDDDRLRIYISKDCGQTWFLREQYRGQTDLQTAPDHSGFFVPNGPGEWVQGVVDNIPVDYHVSDFRIKFWFESYGGNNLFLDDINIIGMGTVGVSEMNADLQDAILVPNPTSGATELVMGLPRSGDLTVELTDATGRVVSLVADHQVMAGQVRVNIPTEGLRNGIYFVRSWFGENSRVLQLVKQ